MPDTDTASTNSVTTSTANATPSVSSAKPSVAGKSSVAGKTTAANETDVYAIQGADPEVLAYAMAKYSRSSLSMKESLAEISTQRAEQFLNTFYFQYGHRSIADLAHIPLAIERLSLLAAITLVDEQRWDGQERSTRYQNFRKSGWYTPQFGKEFGEEFKKEFGAAVGGWLEDPPSGECSADSVLYTSSIEVLFKAYDRVGEGMLESLKSVVAQPAEMKDESYLRTLKARAFDVARYLLPLATNTSLGQIVSARTLEGQISRLLTSEFREVRSLGEKLKAAAAAPAWNVSHDEARVLCSEVGSADDACGKRLCDVLLRPAKAAPTLLKYATANDYAAATRVELRQAASELMAGQRIEDAPVVDLVEDAGSLEIELATSLLYAECNYSWRQLQRGVAALSAPQIAEIVALGVRHRGAHDELPRAFCAGQSFKFDLLMDIGGFRDMHRHRRCVQLIQPYTDAHGYETPVCPGQPTLAEAGLEQTYTTAMDAAHAAYRAMCKTAGPQSAAYLLPLGTRVRAMFKMDFSEALYISELRSGVAGHFSYRRVAWEMYLAIARRHPGLAESFRIQNVYEPVDLLKR